MTYLKYAMYVTIHRDDRFSRGKLIKEVLISTSLLLTAHMLISKSFDSFVISFVYLDNTTIQQILKWNFNAVTLFFGLDIYIWRRSKLSWMIVADCK